MLFLPPWSRLADGKSTWNGKKGKVQRLGLRSLQKGTPSVTSTPNKNLTPQLFNLSPFDQIAQAHSEKTESTTLLPKYSLLTTIRYRGIPTKERETRIHTKTKIVTQFLMVMVSPSMVKILSETMDVRGWPHT